MASLPFSLNGRLVLLGLVLIGLAFVGCGGGGARLPNSIPPPPVNSGTLTLTASSDPVRWGASTVLTWTSTNVDQVESSNFGATAVSGTMTVGPIKGPTDYYITCRGPGGLVTGTVTASVTGSEIPPNSLVFYWSRRLVYVPLNAPEGNMVVVCDLPGYLLGIDPTANYYLSVVDSNYRPDYYSINWGRIYSLDTGHLPNQRSYYNTGDIKADKFLPNGLIAMTSPRATRLTRAGYYNTGDIKAGKFLPNGLIAIRTDDGLEIYPVTDNSIPSTRRTSGWPIAVNGDGSYAILSDSQGQHLTTFPGLRVIMTLGPQTSEKIEWSPTSEQIAYEMQMPPGVNNIYTMWPNGSGRRQLVANGRNPCFDPTGTLIYFFRPNEGIYVMPAAGGTETLVRAFVGDTLGFFTVR